MIRESAASGTIFLGESAHAAHEYYHLGRIRSKSADLVLSAFATTVSSIMIAKGIKRDELFDKYDVKLWSYNDNLALFALTTIPPVVAMAALWMAHRGIHTLRAGLAS